MLRGECDVAAVPRPSFFLRSPLKGRRPFLLFSNKLLLREILGFLSGPIWGSGPPRPAEGNLFLEIARHFFSSTWATLRDRVPPRHYGIWFSDKSALLFPYPNGQPFPAQRSFSNMTRTKICDMDFSARRGLPVRFPMSRLVFCVVHGNLVRGTAPMVACFFSGPSHLLDR